MATFVSVRVNLAGCEELFSPAGGVGVFGQRVNVRARDRAKQIAPERTGALRRSITASPIAHPSTLSYTITIGSSLPHAKWVNDGTRTPILPKRGTWLAVGKREGKFNGGRGVPKRFVHGQRAQHFLENGMSSAMAAAGIPVALIF